MLYFVFYDIRSDRVRMKVAKKLQAAGYERLQKSIFIGLEHPKRLKGLWQTLRKLVAASRCPTDKLFVVRTSKEALKQMLTLGRVEVDLEYLTGEKHTLMIQGEE